MRICLMLALAFAFSAIVAPRNATATIVVPVGATASSTNSGSDIGKSFDRSGLNPGYTPGDDFDTYIKNSPTHDPLIGNEWVAAQSTPASWIVYDFGSVRTIDAIAIWNADVAGFASATFLTSEDGVSFEELTTVQLSSNSFNAPYLADVFTFAAVDVQYFQLALFGCPVVVSGTYNCALGEVAFREAVVSAVPLPAALPLFLTALLSLGLAGWRRARATS